MKIDRYTKVVLTIIAIGVIGLNIHFFKDDFVKEVHALESHEHNSYAIYDFESSVKSIVNDCFAPATKIDGMIFPGVRLFCTKY